MNTGSPLPLTAFPRGTCTSGRAVATTSVASAPALELSGVSFALGGRKLLDDIDLRCEYGSVTALIGPNGAGKSTLLALMAGDQPAKSGTLSLAGQPIESLSVRELASHRAVMPQDSVLRFAYLVEEVVGMGRQLHVSDPGLDGPVIAQAMRVAEIAHLASRDAMTLSGGEQARTTFARILTQQTSILLLDEPTAALDLRHQERLLQSAANLARRGCCVVVVLHDLNLAAAHADYLVLLADGRVILQGSPWEVLDAERLGVVYRQPVSVLAHPQRGCPIVVTRDAAAINSPEAGEATFPS
ncbi:heme ABC transporter ATP-binding protein [Salinicola acroporae]|uniref:Heme ABC transporter ATP-binding protein n=1 Tax=Salinicola acroporae TaxID=1541440 RepID=A0ABT6I3T4_9GAMM|nr:heme ABC transporter ATP-binding protein [Salinicola acroporae]MDH4572335.1 heme ABC transporter ATP-binding protein [Salinicola acroporae]